MIRIPNIEKNKSIYPYEIAEALSKRYPIFNKKGDLKAGYADIIRSLGKLPNLDRIIEALKDQKAKSIKEHRLSYKEGLRLGLVDYYKDDNKNKNKKCMLMSTSANEPDLEHAQLEGESDDCGVVLSWISRFGCKHGFKQL